MPPSMNREKHKLFSEKTKKKVPEFSRARELKREVNRLTKILTGGPPLPISPRSPLVPAELIPPSPGSPRGPKSPGGPIGPRPPGKPL